VPTTTTESNSQAFAQEGEEHKDRAHQEIDTGASTSTRHYAYDELRKSKEKYKEENHQLRKAIHDLKTQNQNLCQKLEDAQDKNHCKGGRNGSSDQQHRQCEANMELKSFLKAFNMHDLAHAQSAWAYDLRELQRTKENLTKLQNEALSRVDRFDPSFDTIISSEFVELNKSIGKLSKTKHFASLMLAGDILAHWSEDALWDGTVNPALDRLELVNEEKRLLLRQAIWKFLAECLFNRAEPFASFSGVAGELASRFCFDKLFKDHIYSQDAAKWRAITVTELAKHDSDDHKLLCGQLVHEFTDYVMDKMLQDIDITEDDVKIVMSHGDVKKRLEETLTRAIGFSRRIMGERACFTIEVPSLQDMKFTKHEEEESVTAMGQVAGIVEPIPSHGDVETDLPGNIRLMGSPALIKHGNSGGQRLDQSMILVRAFVVVDPTQ
jgi:hypothetical protein